MERIKIDKNRDYILIPKDEYDELKLVFDKYKAGIEKRKQATKKYYDSMTKEQRTERAKKAWDVRRNN